MTTPKKLILLAGLGLIIGLLVGYFIFYRGAKTLNQDGISSATMATSSLSGEEITVDDQMPGEVVLIAKAKINAPTWIVVRELTENDRLANILGAAYLAKAGTYTGEQVQLLREISDGQKYSAIIYNDDGDRMFDYKLDTPRLNEQGKMTRADFSVVLVGSRGD